jgi:hypothetical protein
MWHYPCSRAKSLNIIRAISKQGYKYNDLKSRIKNREKWIENWNQYLNDNLKGDKVQDVFLLNSLLEISDFFDYKPIISTKIIEKLQETLFSYDFFPTVEPQVLSYALKITQYFNVNFKYLDQVKEYVNDSIQSNFNKYGVAKFNNEENYFGIALANEVGFSYDKNKMNQFLKGLLKRNFEENSTINNHEKLVYVYFLIKSFIQLGNKLEPSQSQLLQESINTYLSNLQVNDNTVLTSNLKDFKMGFELLNNQKLKIIDNTISNGDTLIEKLNNDKGIYSSITCVYLYDLIKNTSSQKKYSNIISEISISLDNLKINYGFKNSTKSEKMDIISTYLGNNFIYESSGLSVEGKKNIKKLLNDEIIKNSEDLEINKDNKNLTTIYYAVLLSTLYSDLN